MIDKQDAVQILVDIEQALEFEDWAYRVNSSAKQYKNDLMIRLDDELKVLIEKHKHLDEESEEAVELSRQISDRLAQIFNEKRVY